jgi:hypothetical protein
LKRASRKEKKEKKKKKQVCAAFEDAKGEKK